jgi:glycine/D-amino acid oxidase-like deaminating enzyme
MPRDWIPQFGFQPETGLAFAYGYTGHGVATTNLAGRTLADLITGRESELTSLPLVGHRSRDWEPEPLRWIGVRYVQAALGRLDDRGERTGRAPSRWDPAMRMASN